MGMTEFRSATARRIRLSRPVRESLVIFLATRGGLLLFAPLAFFALSSWIPDLLHTKPPPFAPFTGTMSFPAQFFLGPWSRWDSAWYLQIARQGYFSAQSTAFFPLYPVLTSLLGHVFRGNFALGGLLISLASCLGAFILLYKLVELDFGPGIARRTVLFLAIFPTSFFFQAIYTESLFLLLGIASLYAARRQRYLLAGCLGFLAALTRNTGLLLLLPLAIIYFKQHHRNWRQIREDAIFLLFPLAGLGLWMLYLGIHFRNPWLFSDVQQQWARQFISPLRGGPLNAFYHGFIIAADWSRHIPGGFIQSFWPHTARDRSFLATEADFDFIFGSFFAIMSIAAFWRLPWEYPVYSLALIMVPASFPHTPSNLTSPLFSMPRFVLPAFPVLMLLAIWSEKRRWLNFVIVPVFLVLLLFLCSRFILQEWVA